MTWVLVRHRVEDYGRWRPVFDRHVATLDQIGCRGGQVFRTADDPNEILVLLAWEDEERLRAFMTSPELREKMRESGVIGEPDIRLLDELPAPLIGRLSAERAA